MDFEQWVINQLKKNIYIYNRYIIFVNHSVCLFGEDDIYEIESPEFFLFLV